MNLKNTAKKIGSGALNILKGTLQNMSGDATKKRYAAMDAHEAEKRAGFIRENFGNEEKYREVTNPDDPMFQSDVSKIAKGVGKAGKKIGKGLGSFAERLVGARKTAVEAGAKKLPPRNDMQTNGGYDKLLKKLKK